MSAAEVRFVCDRAAMNAIRRVFPPTSDRVVDIGSLCIEQRDFDDALVAQAAASGQSAAAMASSFLEQCDFDGPPNIMTKGE